MRFAIATVAFFAASSSASAILARQDTNILANQCLTNAAGGVVDNTNLANLCGKHLFLFSSFKCLEQLPGIDQNIAKQRLREACSLVGVTLAESILSPIAIFVDPFPII